MKTAQPLPMLLATILALLPAFCGCRAAPAKSAATAGPSIGPIDSRLIVAASRFERQADGSWVTREIKPRFAFDELIYSWHLRLAADEGFRLYLRVKSEAGDDSPWLYAGYWGQIRQVEKRKEPEFEWGKIAMDQVLLRRKAKSFQFKIVNEGSSPLKQPPSFYVIVTDNTPTPALARHYAPRPEGLAAQTVILDLPLRRQADSKGTPMSDRCQSAALASAMQYFGKPVGLEDIVPLTYDVEYDFPGIWPRTIGAGLQHGFEAYIDRFRNWADVRRTVAQNKVILCSITMPPGDYKAPPYPKIGGHIVALNGVTEDGRVVVTDSALWKDNCGYCLQWYTEDFEKIWMKNKGGVGMVICPPPQAQMKLIHNLPPFPADRLEPATPANNSGS
jgi:Peptidase_C39 like family